MEAKFKPESLSSLFSESEVSMKTAYSGFLTVMEDTVKVIKTNSKFFKSLQANTSDRLSIHDELNRPNRWLGTYSLHINDLVKIAKKNGFSDQEIGHYNKALDIVRFWRIKI